MADLKKVFIYVKADSTTNADSLRQQVVTTSATDYNDRIFFLADTEEIVTHGHVFGVSKEGLSVFVDPGKLSRKPLYMSSFSFIPPQYSLGLK